LRLKVYVVVVVVVPWIQTDGTDLRPRSLTGAGPAHSCVALAASSALSVTAAWLLTCIVKMTEKKI